MMLVMKAISKAMAIFFFIRIKILRLNGVYFKGKSTTFSEKTPSLHENCRELWK